MVVSSTIDLSLDGKPLVIVMTEREKLYAKALGHQFFDMYGLIFISMASLILFDTLVF
jgi:hypothetical protein